LKRTKKIINEFKEAKPKEISYAIWENFFFGFSGAIIVPFIALRMDLAVLCGYLIHYFYISKVINRPKYTTSLAKFILFPIPTAFGGFTGYKIAYFVSQYLTQYIQ
jgi:hypothetical protein|tara:strand:+ start:4900 stop:5217 length:318 start_codon:yes stop_codon:yes gene_type:complete